MALGFIVLPALLGYWFVERCHATRFLAERKTGYHLVFWSAILGVVLLLPAYLAAHGLAPHLSQCLRLALGVGDIPFEYWATFVLALLHTEVWVRSINSWKNEEFAARVAAEYHGDLIELRLVDALDRSAHVELSLRSGKSYVGMVLNSGVTTSGESDVSLILTASGYRKANTHELIFTTFYVAVLDKWLREDPGGRSTEEIADYFTLVIPKSEIVSARLFDMTMYGLFEEAKAPATD